MTLLLLLWQFIVQNVGTRFIASAVARNRQYPPHLSGKHVCTRLWLLTNKSGDLWWNATGAINRAPTPRAINCQINLPKIIIASVTRG
jgi:hypothetical protein